MAKGFFAALEKVPRRLLLEKRKVIIVTAIVKQREEKVRDQGTRGYHDSRGRNDSNKLVVHETIQKHMKQREDKRKTCQVYHGAFWLLGY